WSSDVCSSDLSAGCRHRCFAIINPVVMLQLSPHCTYYLFQGHTDMRKGFDSLCGIVTAHMQLNYLSGAVFIFFNRKHNQVKLLHFEGDGFAIYHKRLEKGTY